MRKTSPDTKFIHKLDWILLSFIHCQLLASFQLISKFLCYLLATALQNNVSGPPPPSWRDVTEHSVLTLVRWPLKSSFQWGWPFPWNQKKKKRHWELKPSSSVRASKKLSSTAVLSWSWFLCGQATVGATEKIRQKRAGHASKTKPHLSPLICFVKLSIWRQVPWSTWTCQECQTQHVTSRESLDLRGSRSA